MAATLACAAPAAVAEGEVSAASALDPALLGASEAALRERVGGLSAEPVRAARSVFEQVHPAPEREAAGVTAPPYADQQRLAGGVAGNDVARVEYDLHRGRVYRLRARLAPRFERPVLGALVSHLRERLGPPVYDQTLEAELGSDRADLRRVGWLRGERRLELRQLHPLAGGPTYLSLADRTAMQAIVDAEAVVMPEPESSGSWWRVPQAPPQLPSPEEGAELAAALDPLLAMLGFPKAGSPERGP
ncbi:MAG: hypothetical protein ABFS41_18115 [Myxococcota bacterium]